MLGGQRGQRRGVDAAGQQHADRDVGDEVRAHRVAQALAQLVGERLPRLVAVLQRRPLVGVALDPRHARLPHQHVAGRQLADLAIDRPRPVDRVEGEEGLERVEVDLARGQRLELRREHEVLAVAVVERLDPEAVAREHEPAPLRVPHRDREHAPQPLGEARPVLLVEVDEHLGVGVRRAEAMAGRLELRPQLGVVVDLAVLDDDDPPVLVGDRLVAALEVDDREPPRGQPGLAEHHLARAVGPAVHERVAHGAQQRGIDGPPVSADDAADPAHPYGTSRGARPEITSQPVSATISRYRRTPRSAMYSKSWASFSAQVMSRVSRSCAKPVMPGRTTSRCQ